MPEAYAEVEETLALNLSGHQQPCVYATCIDSGIQVGPVWGTDSPSILRVLAELTQECDCGATFHHQNPEDETETSLLFRGISEN
jgi:hypothetical protein